jgi:hypothetical protein
MFRKLSALVVLSAALAVPSASMAANRPAVALTAPKNVQVTRDANVCSDASGNALPCLVVNFTVTNSTQAAASCTVSVVELGGFVAFDSTVGASSTAGGAFTAPYTGQRRLTLVLTCNGSTVKEKKARVRVDATS